MTEFLQYALLGLGAGAVYALLAQGIVLIFRGSGVLNLAHGAFAMLAAYLFNVMHGDHGWSVFTAGLVCVVVLGVIGVMVDQLIMRRLRTASPLSRLIATMGLLLLIQTIASIIWGAVPVYVQPIFPADQVSIFGATIGADRIWMLAIAVGITAGLMALWRYTRVGWVVEAVSGNQRIAASLGWSPERVSALTWCGGAVLAALAGILISPITQLSVTNLTLIVIAGLAAALIGGFRSFPLTLLGGLLIGVMESVTGNYIHVTGAAAALPFVVIIVILTVTGSSLPLRGHVFDRLPAVGTGRVNMRVVVGALVVGLAVVSLVTASSWLNAIAGTFAIAIVLLSIVVLTGYAGQVSLAQFAIAGLGALIAARLVASQGWSFIPAMGLGVVGAMVIGLLFAVPALRTRGVNLAVVTLGLGLATQSVVFNNAEFTETVAGVSVGPQSLFGWSIDPLAHPGRYAGLVFVVFVLCALLVANLRRSSSGRWLIAVRSNERAAAACGINVFSAKLYAFAVSGALAGLGGVFIGFASSSVTFAQFGPIQSITAVAQTVIGGIGFIVGPALGATMAPSSIGSVIALQWQDVVQYLPLLSAVLLIFTLIDAPDGAVATLCRRLRRLFRMPAPSPVIPAEIESKLEPKAVPPKNLTVEGLTVRYGGVTAVEDLNVTVKPGEIVSLIGPNGAGKTSAIDAISGFTDYSGVVTVDDVGIDGWAPHRRAKAGLARSFQGLELFSDMTVLENLQSASERRSASSLISDLVRPAASVLPPPAVAAIHEFDLTSCLHSLPDELSQGQRRLVAIARAVAANPSILLLDEPVAGLDDGESAEFGALVRRLCDTWGMAILVIEHDMDFVMGISDRIVVIEFGKTIVEGTSSVVQNSEEAIAAYLGETVDELEADVRTASAAAGRGEGD